MGARPMIKYRRELAAAQEAKTEPAEEKNDAAPVDTSAEVVDTTRTGPVVEDESEIGRRIAHKMGWRPKEEWTRDPAKWRDWSEYLEHTPAQVEALQERNRKLEESNKRTAQAAAAAIEESRRVAQQEAEAKLRAAVEAQDPEAAVAAGRELAKSSVAPETVAWISKNSWFEADPEAHSLARAVVERSARAGATIPEQLEAAEAAVRKRFPEHFDEPAPRVETTPAKVETPKAPEREIPLSEALKRAAPAVASGSRSTPSAPKEKGWDDIPSADRNLFIQKLERKLVGRGKSVEEVRASYAKNYWMTQSAQ